jgi:hypothetical protein
MLFCQQAVTDSWNYMNICESLGAVGVMIVTKITEESSRKVHIFVPVLCLLLL